MSKPVIICVDDERSVLQGLRMQLERCFKNKFSFEVADNGEEALELLQEILAEGIEIPVVISDQLMPGMKGDEFLTNVHKINPRIRKILLTGQASVTAVGSAVNSANLYRYISKPWSEQDLELTVDEAAKSYFMDLRLTRQLKVLSDLNKSAQELAREVHPAALIQKILNIVLQDTGADKGFIQIHLPKESLQYIGEMVKGNVEIRPVQTQFANNFYPATWALLSFQQKAAVHGTPSELAKTITPDAYFTQSKSKAAYCTTIVKNESLQGTLFLEYYKQDLASEQLEYLNLLLAQASISIDNAILYQNLEEKVAERTRTIEEKNQDILDSMYYARRIQISILPRNNVLVDTFPKSFILYLPRDIVSGDFYWFTHYRKNNFLIGAVDCTGHGVPGAFMSVMGNNLLNQIIKEYPDLSSDKILAMLHQLLKETLNRGSNQAHTHDGMDIALANINLETKALEFSGANRPILMYRNDELIEYKGDRCAIGGSIFTNTHEITFKRNDIQLLSGDILYFFTDGITDQFGGPKRRKLGTPQFKDLLLRLNQRNLPLTQQKEEIEKNLNEWKNNLHQTDDILVLAIQIP